MLRTNGHRPIPHCCVDENKTIIDNIDTVDRERMGDVVVKSSRVKYAVITANLWFYTHTTTVCLDREHLRCEVANIGT